MDQQGRTWLCSVVFLDLAGYTERSVTRQVNMKEDLRKFVEDAVAHLPENERIIVDTGDGAALCYLGDPEQALFTAIRLREALLARRDGRGEVAARIGINLGPVKFVRSLNGQLSPLGDGINNAQRVMGFAEPNQILVSRSFYDVIACLSHEYAQLFSYVGVRRDKHIKEHVVYEVRVPGCPDQMVTQQTTRLIAEQVMITVRLSAPTWEPGMLKRAELALAESIGPVARVLVKKAAERARDAAELARLLAESVSLPEQRQRLVEIIAGAAAPVVADAASVGRVRTGEPPAAARAVPPVGPWEPAEIQIAEARLAEHLGPLARLLVKRAAEKTRDRGAFYQLLAQELPTAAEREVFLKTCRD